MPISPNVLFHRPSLRKAIERHFDPSRITDFPQKRAILAQWRQAIASAALQQSGEIALHGDFLIDIFARVLGYARQIESPVEWQLAHEQKTLTDATKADGALGFFTKEAQDIRAVIELKSVNVDLDAKQHHKNNKDSAVEQAFAYAHKSGEKCQWIIVSNYAEIRLYHASFSGKCETFRLLDLAQEEEFKRFYFLLAREFLLSKHGESAVEMLRRQSQTAEQAITLDFYEKYSKARRHLFEHLKQQNPQHDDLTLLGCTQRLLDRFIFIYFCEDAGDLLPEKTFRQLIQRTQASVLLSKHYGSQKIWFEMNAFFGAMDEGLSSHQIPGFNGELFKPDALIDSLRIEDDMLIELAALSDYDFRSDLNVNILGHIFEQSISDLEELRAEIRGETLDRKQGKRKKEGVFYTPEYVTRYIVEQAVGGWLAERRRELGEDDLPELTPEDDAWIASTAKKKPRNERVERHIAFWEAYLEQLKQITVLDPACGSGAFLTQTFDFLMQEGEQVNRELNRLRRAEQLGLFSRKTWEKTVLRNNLFGVDLNGESVEITKLALWLKTAKKDDRLTALNDHIRCGNSLIDDPAVVGERAFDWAQAFPAMMERGGFDVVIGNPPYGATLTSNEKDFIAKRFSCFDGNFDVYSAFVQLAFTKLLPNGCWGYIMPVSWQSGENYLTLRQYLQKNSMLRIGLKLPYDVFPDAYVDTGIYLFQKTTASEYTSKVYEFPVRYDCTKGFDSKIDFNDLPNRYWQSTKTLNIVLNPAYYELQSKMQADVVKLGDITDSVRGILPNDSDVHEQAANHLKKFFIGNLYRYVYSNEFKWVLYGNNLRECPKDYSYFCGERILIRRLISRQFRVMAMYADEEFVNKKDLYNIKLNSPAFHVKYVLSLLNSQLISYLKTRGSTAATKDDFSQLTLSDIREIPIKQISLDAQQPFVENSDKMLELNRRLHAATQKFTHFLDARYHPKTLSTKLMAFDALAFDEFLGELKKQHVALSKQDEFELLDLFETHKAQIAALRQDIEKTDNEIDQMTYQLYGLSDDEIRLIEGI